MNRVYQLTRATSRAVLRTGLSLYAVTGDTPGGSNVCNSLSTQCAYRFITRVLIVETRACASPICYRRLIDTRSLPRGRLIVAPFLRDRLSPRYGFSPLTTVHGACRRLRWTKLKGGIDLWRDTRPRLAIFDSGSYEVFLCTNCTVSKSRVGLTVPQEN